jgi:hypothetical protein
MPFDVIYDSFGNSLFLIVYETKFDFLFIMSICLTIVDASEIVSFVLSQEGGDSLAQKFGLQRPAEEIHAGDVGEPNNSYFRHCNQRSCVCAVLEAKYGEALKNIAALRGTYVL